jgi:hypothetical protein
MSWGKTKLETYPGDTRVAAPRAAAKLRRINRSTAGYFRWGICALLIALFLRLIGDFYIPGQGFSYLVAFGSLNSGDFLPELRRLNHYEFEGTRGYDGQYYAQIAMHPHLRDPVLANAVDGLAYRARRILFCILPYLLGGGDPARVLQLFAVQNFVAWLAIALLLFRWLPPDCWGNVARWAAVVFSLGLCSSVGRALLDGPSLLLILIGIAAAETARPWWAAAIFGAAGLGKETNVLAAVSLPLPSCPDRAGQPAALLPAAARVGLVCAPIILWTLALHRWTAGGAIGVRNFGWPLAGYVGKWREIAQGFRQPGQDPDYLSSFLIQLALTAQMGFFLLRPRGRDPWWRVGAAYSLLAVLLGEAVWESYPGAASRVLLPMTVAFNLLVPRARRWWPLLILGNLSLWSSPDALKRPGRDSAVVAGPRDLRMIEATGAIVTVTFPDSDWYPAERSLLDFWRWSRGSASLSVYNPQSFPLTARLDFRVKSIDRRRLTLTAGSARLWDSEIGPPLLPVQRENVVLAPGVNVLTFRSDLPPAPPPGDARAVGFSLRGFTVTITGRAP